MNDSSKLNIRIDEESPDSQFREEIDGSVVKQLNKRITRISILVLCLAVVIILLGYFDIKKRLAVIDSTGNTGVQALSKNMESRFSSLSVQQAKLEDALTKKILPLEKATASIQASLKEALTAIKFIRSARKSDNKKNASSMTAVENTLADIPKDLERISFKISTIDEKYTKELSVILKNVTAIKNDSEKLETDIASLSSEKLDQDALDVAMKTQLTAYMKALNQLTSNFEDKIKSLETTVKELQKRQAVKKPQKQIIPGKTPPSELPPTNQVPAAKSSKDAVRPQPGTIVEQNIE
jgi:DNA repair exonuclease SbcCD ATPase subunit